MQSTKNEEELILNRYQPIETAGVGGYAKVIHAYDTRLKREVAIKVVDLGKRGNASSTVASEVGDSVPGLAEARAAGKLANANIVTIYDCEVSNNEAYVIEEYVEGITLTTLLHKFEDSVDLDVIAHVFKSVATAVMAAHNENILHLDIKPDNILIGRGGEVKVADFGLATLMDLNGEGSATAGTLGYMPLEQMHHESLDVRTDEWSLAMVTYEMLTGTNPFASARSVQEAERLMMSSELVVPSECFSELTDEADDAVFKALNVNMDARFASVRQFMSELRHHLGNAAEGKKKLAVLVNGNDEKMVATSTIEAPSPEKPLKKAAPIQFIETETVFIDRMGWKVSDIVLKTLAALGCALVIVFMGNNLQFPQGEAATLFQTQPVLVGVIAFLCAVAVWILPRYAVLAPFAAVLTMCNLNSAWGLMTIYAITFLLWWSFLGKGSDIHSSIFMLSPLAGAFGLMPVAIVLGAADSRKVSHAGMQAAAIFLQSLVFSSFGSCNIMSWDVLNNFSIAEDPSTISQVVGDNFLTMFSDPCTWIICGIWIASALVFAIFCCSKAKVIHIVGALVSGTLLIMCAFVQWPLPTSFEAVNVGNAISGLIADGVAIALAASGFTMQARKDPYEFD